MYQALEHIEWVNGYLTSPARALGVYSSLLTFRLAYVYHVYGGETVDIDSVVSMVVDSVIGIVARFGGDSEALEAATSFSRDLVSELEAAGSLEEAKMLVDEIELAYINKFNEPLRGYAADIARSIDDDTARAVGIIIGSIERREVPMTLTAAGSALIHAVKPLLDSLAATGINESKAREALTLLSLAMTGEDAAIPAYFLTSEFRSLIRGPARV